MKIGFCLINVCNDTIDPSKLRVYRSFHPDKLKFQKYYFPKRSNCIENRIGHKNYKKHNLENSFNFRQFQIRIEKKSARIKVLIASKNHSHLWNTNRHTNVPLLITKTYILHRFFLFFFFLRQAYLFIITKK